MDQGWHIVLNSEDTCDVVCLEVYRSTPYLPMSSPTPNHSRKAPPNLIPKKGLSIGLSVNFVSLRWFASSIEVTHLSLSPGRNWIIVGFADGQLGRYIGKGETDFFQSVFLFFSNILRVYNGLHVITVWDHEFWNSGFTEGFVACRWETLFNHRFLWLLLFEPYSSPVAEASLAHPPCARG